MLNSDVYRTTIENDEAWILYDDNGSALYLGRVNHAVALDC